MDSEKEKEIDEILLTAVRSEMDAGEQILWHQKPVTDFIAWSILPSPLLWLCGLFVFALGIMNDGATDTTRVWSVIVILLILVAFFGMMEIILIPAQATRSIYAVTDKRTMVIKLKGKFTSPDGITAGYSNQSRSEFRAERDTFSYYLLYTLPMHLIFLYIVYDWLVSLVKHFDYFNIGGFALLAIGWILQWYQDLRFPLPQFREQGNALYIVGDWLVSIESLLHEIPAKVWKHANKDNYGDIFLLSKKGCLRIRWIEGVSEALTILQDRKAKS